MRVELDVFGEKQISREILRVGERASDARPVFSSIARYLMGEEEQQFASEGRYASGGWARLKDATIAAKRRAHLDPRILRATDALHRSLTRRGDANQVLVIRPNELRFGTKLAYARFHQSGTSSSPRRRPLELRETARREVVRRLQRFLLTGQAA
jgi:phage gpG-like protein